MTPASPQFPPLEFKLGEGRVMAPSLMVSLQGGTKGVLNKFLLIMNKRLDESTYNPPRNIMKIMILRL